MSSSPDLLERSSAVLFVNPPGDLIGIAVPALHFDPEIWIDPHRFRPDRFVERKPTPFEYMPFGGGYRRAADAAARAPYAPTPVGSARYRLGPQTRGETGGGRADLSLCMTQPAPLG